MNENLSGYLLPVHDQWQRLMGCCPDGDSQNRLADLWAQISQFPSGQSTSAQAEIQTASFLAEAGFSLSFLKASSGRTADLECYVDGHRLFVEVTVIQSTQGSVKRSQAILRDEKDDEFDEFFEQALVKRLVARMSEKAKQLEKYCAPVLLAVSVPDIMEKAVSRRDICSLDLQRLTGMLVGVLAEVPQLSAVLLTLWNAPAQIAQNAIRIHQVSYVTRSSGTPRYPRVRLLAHNAFARFKMPAREIQMIENML